MPTTKLLLLAALWEYLQRSRNRAEKALGARIRTGKLSAADVAWLADIAATVLVSR